jgi:hypothetical protein
MTPVAAGDDAEGDQDADSAGTGAPPIEAPAAEAEPADQDGDAAGTGTASAEPTGQDSDSAGAGAPAAEAEPDGADQDPAGSAAVGGSGASDSAGRPSGEPGTGAGWIGAIAGREADTRPEDSARPAANNTSAAARPEEHGRRSPQTGQIVIPSRGPAPPACAFTISRAVRASTLSGSTYVPVDAILPSIPRRYLARSAQVHRLAGRFVPFSRNRSPCGAG